MKCKNEHVYHGKTCLICTSKERYEETKNNPDRIEYFKKWRIKNRKKIALQSKQKWKKIKNNKILHKKSIDYRRKYYADNIDKYREIAREAKRKELGWYD